jgi:hypothetical protein
MKCIDCFCPFFFLIIIYYHYNCVPVWQGGRGEYINTFFKKKSSWPIYSHAYLHGLIWLDLNILFFKNK